MKVWKKYEQYLLKGEWHVHTNYTDGKNTVFEICDVATKLGVPLIAFTEHVRKKLTYNFNDLLYDIERAREMFPQIIILSGVEAKVLPSCELDVKPEILKEVDYPIFAYYSFPSNKELYLTCLQKIMKNKYVNSWAHPGLFIKKTQKMLTEEELLEVFKIAKKNEILLEKNKKYQLPFVQWEKLAKNVGVKFVVGSGIHSIDEFISRRKKFNSDFFINR